ncbi:MAG: hypothetical protein KatS3mg070_0941 [Meiothermus sp.]|uniref:AHH domain-containing protein n=1 Tax=Meiothermus sp. TaxID=1955249 RepID=UPI0021DD3D00|nr:AHH domain-containing protein [Meiothermus sp.]GIW27578.1 MAG: hypothetical protein KatS3mg070_0941 [Meiothermus sp.]
MDGLEQLYNAATGRQVDPVLAVLSAAGLALDLGTGGVGDVTAGVKAAYRVSLAISRQGGGLVALVIREQFVQFTRGRLSPQALVDGLRQRFGRVVEIVRAPGCRFGPLGLGCVVLYDKTATAVRARESLQPDTALRKVDVGLGDARRSNFSEACYLGAVSKGAKHHSLAELSLLVVGLTESQITVQSSNGCLYTRFNKAIQGTFRSKFAAKGIPQSELDDAAPHHIVPMNATKAFAACDDGGFDNCSEARRILAKAGVSVNEASNGVLLPWKRGELRIFDTKYPNATEHSGMHTKVYFRNVYDRLSELDRRFGSNPDRLSREVRKELQKIADELLAGTFPTR